MNNIDTIISTVRSLAAGMMPRRGRINSFAVIDAYRDIDSDSLNAAIREADNGWYWGRAWQAGGKNPEDICVEWALLFIQLIDSALTGNDMNRLCHRIRIGIASPRECDGCGYRNDTQVELDNSAMLMSIVREMTNTFLYKAINIPTSIGGIGISNYWLTPSMALYYAGLGVTFPKFSSCVKAPVRKAGSLQFKSSMYGTKAIIVTTTEIEVCDCDMQETTYDYSITEYGTAGRVACETC